MTSTPAPRIARGPVVAAAVAQASVGFAIGGMGSVLVLLARDLDVPPSDLEWLASGFGGGLLLSAALGPTILRAGPSPLLRLGSLLLAAGMMALAVAPETGVVVAGSLSLGLGAALLVLVTPVLLSGPSAVTRLSQVTGISSLAGVCAPLLLGTLDTADGAGRWALLLPVPALLASAALGVRTADERAPTARPTERPRFALTRGGLPTTLARPVLRLVFAVSVEFALVVWAAARLHESGLSPTAAASAAVAFTLGMAAGRLGSAPLTHVVTPATIAVSGTAAAGVGTIAVAAGTDPLIVALGLAAAGFGIGPQYPLSLAAVMHTPGVTTATAAAVGAIASGIAILTAPVLVGRVGQTYDLATAYWLALIALAVLAALHGRAAGTAGVGRSFTDRYSTMRSRVAGQRVLGRRTLQIPNRRAAAALLRRSRGPLRPTEEDP